MNNNNGGIYDMIIIIIIFMSSSLSILLLLYILPTSNSQDQEEEEQQQYLRLAMAQIKNNTADQKPNNDDNDDIIMSANNNASLFAPDSYYFTKEGDAALYDFMYDEAIKYYDKALALQSNNTNALNGKAYALSKLNRYEEAVYRYQTRKMACLLLKKEEAMARFLILETCPKLNLCTTILLSKYILVL